MWNQPVAVFAGTPVDTQMGADLLEARGIKTRNFPVSANPSVQTEFQNSPQSMKNARILEMYAEAKAQGCEQVFVYCNSLSGAVDFRRMENETGMQTVTPLRVYASIARKLGRVGVLAANASGVSGIERTVLGENPKVEIAAVNLLSLVWDIERGLPPEEIIEKWRVVDLVNWMQGIGCEALVLGCTHFPYVKEALAAKVKLPIIDPAEEMIRMLETK